MNRKLTLATLLIVFATLTSAQFKLKPAPDDTVLVPIKPNWTLEVPHIEVTDGAPNLTRKMYPHWNVQVVPQLPFPSTTTSYTIADTGTVYMTAVFLSDSALYIACGVVQGTLSGSGGRIFAHCLFDSSGVLLSQTEGYGFAGSGATTIVGFRGAPQIGVQDTLRLGPGLYYHGFAASIGAGTTVTFNSPAMGSGTFGGVFTNSSDLNGGKIWFGTASNRWTYDGDIVFPSTTGTMVKATTAFKTPWVVLIPLNIGPGQQ